MDGLSARVTVSIQSIVRLSFACWLLLVQLLCCGLASLSRRTDSESWSVVVDIDSLKKDERLLLA